MKAFSKYLLSIAVVGIPLFLNAQKTMTLEELYNIAETESKSIYISRISLEAANEAVESAKTALLPQVNISLSGSYIGCAMLMGRDFSSSGTTDVIIAGLGPQKVDNGIQNNPHWGNSFSIQAFQIVYSGGAISAGIRMAELSEKMAEINIDRNRQEVRFMLTGFYLDIYKLENQIEVIDKNIELTNKIIENMESKFREGMVLKRDITRYELQRQNLQLAKVKLQDAIDIIIYQLNNTLHLEKEIAIKPDKKALDELSASLTEIYSQDIWQEIALENNADIRMTEVATELAHQNLIKVQAAKKTTVSIIAEDNLFGPFTNDLIPVNANVNTWFIGIGVKYNLSSLWNSKHVTNKAKLEYIQSQEQNALIKENVENSIHSLYVNLMTSFKEVETMKKQVEMAQQNFDVVNKRYNNGLSLLTDILDASNMKLYAEMDYVNARLSLLYAYYKLKYSTHTL